MKVRHVLMEMLASTGAYDATNVPIVLLMIGRPFEHTSYMYDDAARTMD